MSNSPGVSIGLMTIGMILIPVGDSIAKVILNTTPYSSYYVAWVRFLIGGVIVLPFLWFSGHYKWWNIDFLKKQLLRAVLIVLTVVTIIKAVGMSPIADVFGAFFVGPILSVVLSAIVLKERASYLEWLSVLVGFIGVLFVVQPNALIQLLPANLVNLEFGIESASQGNKGTPDPVQGVYWALLAGVFYGAFLTATRWASSSGPAIIQVAVQFLIATLLLTPFGVIELVQFGVKQPYLLGLNGISSVTANLLSIMALSRARPAVLAPVVYMQVVSATIIGLFVFQDKLSVLASIGLAIIIFSSIFRFDFPSFFSLLKGKL